MINLNTVVLSKGAHSSPEQGLCVMEMTAILAGENMTDSPQCVSPAIAGFLRSWNDSLDDETRQKLKPYALKVIGTRGTDEHELARAWMATDWLCRVFAPAWLRKAGLSEHADALTALSPFLNDTDAQAAQDKLAAAGLAAWSAARLAAGLAAGSAAELAAVSAAVSAAELAAENALQDTVTELQASAFELLDRLIAVHRD